MKIDANRVANTPESIEQSSTLMTNVKEGAAFAGIRYLDNALWFGGAALGLYVENKYGVPAAVVAPTTAATVGVIDYGISGKAVDLFVSDSPEPEQESDGNKLGAVAKEVTALGYAAWGGAGSTVEFNNSLGLQSSRQRRVAQAAIYGAAVSLWTTDLPGFKQGKEILYSAWEYTLENPIQATAGAVAGSTAVFGLFKGIKAFRNWLSERKNPDATEPITEQE